MKNAVCVTFLVMLIFVLSSFSLTLKVGVYSNPPLSFYEDGQAHGIFPEVLNYIAQKQGWTVNYVNAPFSVLLQKLKNAQIDMICPIASPDERIKTCKFSQEYLLSNWAQVYVSYESDINTLFDLNNKRLGVSVSKSDVFSQGNSSVKYFLSHLGIRVNFVKFDTYFDVFKALKNGEIDAGVVSRIFGDTNKLKYDLKETPIVFSPIEEGFAFTKKSTTARIVEPVVGSYLKKMKANPKSILYTSIDKYLGYAPSKFKMPKWAFYIIYILAVAFLILMANVFFLRKMVKKKTEELKGKNEQLLLTNEEINASNEEIKAMNEELENAYTILEETNARFQNVSVLISQLDMVNVKENEFFAEVLDKTLELIPHARYGSISILEDGEWKFVAAKGHDIKLLEDIPLKPEYAYFSNKSEVVTDILKTKSDFLPLNVSVALKKATKPIKQTLIAPLDFSNEILGYITVDIPKESEEFFSDEDMKMIDKFAKITSAFFVARRYLKSHEELQNRIIFVMVKVLEKFHGYTKGHSEHVARQSMQLAKNLGLDRKTQKRIYQAGLLHDIGKLFVPKSILDKNGKLTEEEYNEVKKHPVIGAELIEEGANLRKISLIVRFHHERWDGNGYPQGLKGESIPLESRIMAVCDAFDAMTSNRSYRKALEKEKALEEIANNIGKQFDPLVAKQFLKMMRT